MKKQVQNLLLAIAAGAAIGLGVLVYCSCENKIAGAVLFSFGLISVFLFGLNLYTGKVGYARKVIDFANLGIMVIGNGIGVGVAAFNAKPAYIETAQNLVNTKLTLFLENPWSFFGVSFLCGAIIYLCTAAYKEKGLWQTALIGVPLFILAGTEHSIADIGFIWASRSFRPEYILMILLVVLGNALGAILCNAVFKFARQQSITQK